VPYAKTKDNRLVNEITLGDGYPLSDDLQAIKVGGEASVLQLSSPIPHTTNKGRVKVDGDLEVTGSILKQPTLHILNGGAYNSGTDLFYLPLVGYNVERTATTNYNENIAFVVPYDGRVKKLVLRSEAAPRNTVAGFHKSSEGTEVPNSTATEEITVNMLIDDTAYTFDFTSISEFVAGEIMTISVDPTLAVNDLVWTLVLEYYID
tara:strand:+ start:651 stop:1268 length:618 start_codon:yes stop_codon:yes gene_type:complete